MQNWKLKRDSFHCDGLGFTGLFFHNIHIHMRTWDGSMLVEKFAWLGQFHFITNRNLVNFGTGSLCAR